MKIAVTSTGPTLDSNVEVRFGRCAYFLIIDTDTMEFESIENPNIARGGGAGIQSAQLMSEKGVTTVLTGNCGPNAFNIFGQAGIQVIVGVSGLVCDAVEQFKAGDLSSASRPNVASHFGMGGSRGMGRGGGGRGIGGGRGRVRGMGIGEAAGPIGSFGAGDQYPEAADTAHGLEELKQQAEMLKEQKQQIDKRISQLESGRKAAAFVQSDKCTACGICADVCPVDAITINNQANVNTDLCNACAACVSECPNGAIIITQQKTEG
ncbi:MAG TPA: 4Fe-4S binding protein [Planctomycetes bacterium]|nr:4Fe-4S binding protein [Planctomycetota bacterium]